MGNLNEERLKKFREMGIPQPMAPVDPSMLKPPVKNTEFAAKLAAIKNGAIKEEIDTFIEKEGATKAFVGMEVPSKKKPGTQPKTTITETIKAPTVSGPSFDLYEKALYGDNTPSSASYERASSPTRGYSSDIESTGDGSDFLAGIRARLAEKAAKAGQNPGQKVLNENRQTPNNAPQQKLINEGELKEAITLISTDVCKKLIKQFMSEFLTSQPELIKESDKIKKAEIVKEDIIKMEGKYFKIVPVTVKKK